MDIDFDTVAVSTAADNEGMRRILESRGFVLSSGAEPPYVRYEMTKEILRQKANSGQFGD